MSFHAHSDLVGKHAFLSASNYHWLNYTPEKLATVYRNAEMARRGTELHTLAHDLIRLGIELPREEKSLNMYVNDALAFGMTTEQPLYYSENAFGTADAIAYANYFLRIHDLKTGEVVAGNIHQLEIYAAFFCLEYEVRPGEIEIELRIYQYDDIRIVNPDPHTIATIMVKIIDYDRRIELLKAEDAHG